ncbi:MAG: CbbQ/NirQ/NorQ/GpvN family protein [Janthinobacterium lividum]
MGGGVQEAGPFYREVGGEVALFEAAWHGRLPVMLKGPTGCGKTRFVEHMAWRLGRPLVTAAAHEDMTASDLTGRWLLGPEGTVWQDGPLTRAARSGAICYLDEVVEARQDTVVVLHPLTDTRRMLPLEKCGEVVAAHPDFLLVVSYNPGLGGAGRELKQSTRQRFVAIAFDYPDADTEAEIVAREAGVAPELAAVLVRVGQATRRMRDAGLADGASTRMLIHAARLCRGGIALREAVQGAVVLPITDDADMTHALGCAAEACLG